MAGTQFDPELVERFIASVSRRHDAPQAALPVSRDLALNLGLQTERLAAAVDVLDFATIRAVATHLQSTAAAHGLAGLAEAAELLQASEAGSDLAQLVEIVHEIITLSLTVQRAHLAMDEDAAQVARARGLSIAQ